MVEKSALTEMVAEILEISVDEVQADGNLEELGWDSLSDISFIATADERYGIAVDAATLADAVVVGDLYRILAQGE